MDRYFLSVFNWLENVKKVFGFDLEGYSLKESTRF